MFKRHVFPEITAGQPGYTEAFQRRILGVAGSRLSYRPDALLSAKTDRERERERERGRERGWTTKVLKHRTINHCAIHLRTLSVYFLFLFLLHSLSSFYANELKVQHCTVVPDRQYYYSLTG